MWGVRIIINVDFVQTNKRIRPMEMKSFFPLLLLNCYETVTDLTSASRRWKRRVLERHAFSFRHSVTYHVCDIDLNSRRSFECEKKNDYISHRTRKTVYVRLVYRCNFQSNGKFARPRTLQRDIILSAITSYRWYVDFGSHTSELLRDFESKWQIVVFEKRFRSTAVSAL